MAPTGRRDVLAAFAAGGSAAIAGCTDSLPFSSDDADPVTLCRIIGLSRYEASHELDVTVRDGDETVLDETILLDPSEGNNGFSFDDRTPLTSSKEPFVLTVSLDDQSKTIDTASIEPTSLEMLYIVDANGRVGYSYRGAEC